jgi:hypothetical protein
MYLNHRHSSINRGSNVSSFSVAGVKIAISMPSPRNNGFPINRRVDIIDNLCSTKRGIRKSCYLRPTQQHLDTIPWDRYSTDRTSYTFCTYTSSSRRILDYSMVAMQAFQKLRTRCRNRRILLDMYFLLKRQSRVFRSDCSYCHLRRMSCWHH